MGTAAVIGGAGLLGAGASIYSSNKAESAQKKASKSAQARIKEATEQARGDIMSLFPQAMQSARGGYQSAIDVFGQSAPAQTSAFQQGNIGAQQAILAGLPMAQAAILGGQVDYSALQPFQVQTPDLSFLQRQLPLSPELNVGDQQQQQQGLPGIVNPNFEQNIRDRYRAGLEGYQAGPAETLNAGLAAVRPRLRFNDPGLQNLYPLSGGLSFNF